MGAGGCWRWLPGALASSSLCWEGLGGFGAAGNFGPWYIRTTWDTGRGEGVAHGAACGIQQYCGAPEAQMSEPQHSPVQREVAHGR